jgi:hypothetical protein
LVRLAPRHEMHLTERKPDCLSKIKLQN